MIIVIIIIIIIIIITSEYDQMHLWSDCIEHFLIFLKEI